MHSTPAVALDGPETVELFAHRQTGREHLVVNLVHAVGSVSRTSGVVQANSTRADRSQLFRFEEIAEMPPAGDVTIRIRLLRGKKIRSAVLAPNRTRLKVRHEGREARITIPALGVHAMAVLRF